MKKSKKHEKLNKLWSKVKKPLIICSFALNLLFILIAIVGCVSVDSNDYTTNKKARSYLYADDLTSQVSEPVFPIDMTGSTWSFKPSNMTYSPSYYSSGAFFNYDINATMSATYNNVEYTATKDKITIQCASGTITIGLQIMVTGSNFTYDYPIFYGGYSSNPNVEYRFNNTSPSIFMGDTEFTMTFNSGNDVNDVNFVDFVQNNGTYISGGVLLEPPSYNEYDYVTDIYLSDDFVPSVYVAYGGDLILNGFGARMQSATTFFLDLNGFTFISNGQTFNRVRIAYMPLPAGAPYITDDGTMGISTEDYTDYVYCLGVFYQYVDENDDIVDSVRVVTNRKKLVIADNANINAYDVRPPFMVWVNQNYRSLKVIEDTGLVIDNQYLQYENMSAVQLLQVTSNVTQNVAGMTNAFDLIRHAFESIQGILQMSIFPGVTIGLLMFIPLILTIIMVVIRLVKR